MPRSDYDNTNRGAIWPNDRKEKETHPDYKGSANIGGVEYWVAAWKRRPDASDNYPILKFAFEQKEQRQANTSGEQRRSKPQKTVQPDFDDDIPF